MKIYENSDNTMLLLANLVCENSKMFNEKTEVHDDIPVSFYNNNHDIAILKIKKYQDFVDSIDGDVTTEYYGYAHIGLNLYVNFVLIKNTGSSSAILLRTNLQGKELERVILEMTEDDYE